MHTSFVTAHNAQAYCFNADGRKKTQENNSKLNVFQGFGTQFVISIAKYVQKQEVLYSIIQKFQNFYPKVSKVEGEITKTQ